MLIASTAFILGILSAFYWPEPSLLVSLFAFIASVYLFSKRCLSNYFIVLMILIGFLWGGNYLNDYYHHLLPLELEGKDLSIKARIAEIPVKRHKGWRLIVDVKNSQPIANIKSLQLNWYDDAVSPKVGEVWLFTVRLKRPHGYANPGGFDHEKWMLSRNLHGRGYIRHADRLYSPLGLNIRQRLWDSLQSYPGDAGSLVAALVLGEKHGLSYAQRQLFIDSGTAHLFAISGLHIGMLAGVFYFLAKTLVFILLHATFLPRFLSIAIYRRTPLKVYLACSWLGCTAYSILAGLSLSTQRALIMLSVAYLACALGKRMLSIQSFTIALVLILLVQPAAVLGAGLFLSFLAVAWIAYILHVLPAYLPKAKKVFLIQLLLPVLLWPILQYYFGSSATLGAVANMVLIPLVSVVLLPLCLFASLLEILMPTSNVWILSFIDEIYRGILSFLEAFNAATWASPISWQLSIEQVVLLQLLMLIVLWPRGTAKYLKMMMAILVIIALIPAKQVLEKGDFKLAVIDVGQGLSVLLQTQNHSLLFDTGPEFPSGFNTVQAAVLPYLKNQHINKIDKLILSHGDKDHLGGLAHLIESVDIYSVISGEPERVFTSLNAKQCHRGSSWQWDGVNFDMLWPISKLPGHTKIRPTHNNRSCVLRISSANQSVLLTGDIEKAVEEWLVDNSASLQSDILLAPHHGSNSSSSTNFIQAVNPDWVIFSAGYRSRFGHPHAKVLQRYRDASVNRVATSDCGMLEYSKSRLSCFRRHAQRRWQLKKHIK